MPKTITNNVKHLNALRDGKRVALRAETVYELGEMAGLIKPTREGVGVAFARIKESQPHYHDKTTEYYFVAKGRGVVLLDGEEVGLQPNDVLVIPTRTTHAVRSEGGICVFVLSSPPWKKQDHIHRELKNWKRE
jgi:mannose-6-phosphate isomerase-like protein (cupin superfamily)